MRTCMAMHNDRSIFTSSNGSHNQKKIAHKWVPHGCRNHARNNRGLIALLYHRSLDRRTFIPKGGRKRNERTARVASDWIPSGPEDKSLYQKGPKKVARSRDPFSVLKSSAGRQTTIRSSKASSGQLYPIWTTIDARMTKARIKRGKQFSFASIKYES